MSHAAWEEPFTRFAEVFAQAKAAIPKDPNAMQLATVDAHGKPSVRTVLLKGVDDHGFVFFTNYDSAKGEALLARRVACLNFYWPAIDQQVRVEGDVEVVTEKESDEYFATRARVSQLGAWASHQSHRLESREMLENRLAEVTGKYEGQPVPRPPNWGGFRVKPQRIEFWKAHEFRLHWREEYVKAADAWDKHLLNP